MKDIRTLYQQYCESHSIPFQHDNKVNPYDDTTLFCPAGMQQFKPKFKNPDNTTIANIQSCIRLQDIAEIGDGTHLLHFNMLGLFSFGEMNMQQAVDFWMEFIERVLEIKVDTITIHPDKLNEWRHMYYTYPHLNITTDEECIWSDGEMGGYCTEFYINGVEIGNIVNTLDQFIDVGFGMERLELMANGEQVKSSLDTLQETIERIIDSGYKPGPQKQGYILRKLLRELYIQGGEMEHPFFIQEVERQAKAKVRYERLVVKHPNMPKEWWFDTHGVDLDLL